MNMMNLKSFILIIIYSVITGCSNSNDQEKIAIINLLNENAKRYKQKDLDCIMNTYLKDSNTIALGTEKNFIGIGFESIKENYKRDISQNWILLNYEYKNPIIFFRSDICWLTADVNSKIKVTVTNEFDENEEIIVDLDSRLTAVCKKVDGKWKFVLTNFQHFTNPNDKIKLQYDTN